MGYISSVARNFINKTSKKILGTGRVQKKISVMYYNLKALLDFSANYQNEVMDYKKIISGKRIFYTPEYYKSNDSYGIANTLREYSGYNFPINAIIEHGLYWGNFYYDHEVKNSGLNGLITFGKKREKVLDRVADVPVKTIGPYIYYAKSLLSDEELYEIKRKNGKTLLVFPTHSTERVELMYNQAELIELIKEFASNHGFSTIMICLYFKDILKGKDKAYIENGFKVVTSGYGTDPNFLNRQKTLIMLSDYTMSNDIGTHIGYCVALGKGHIVIDQSLEYIPQSQVDMENIISTEDAVKDREYVKSIFREYHSEITDLQKKVVEVYWGTDCVKSQNELLKILQEFERLK